MAPGAQGRAEPAPSVLQARGTLEEPRHRAATMDALRHGPARGAARGDFRRTRQGGGRALPQRHSLGAGGRGPVRRGGSRFESARASIARHEPDRHAHEADSLAGRAAPREQSGSGSRAHGCQPSRAAAAPAAAGRRGALAEGGERDVDRGTAAVDCRPPAGAGPDRGDAGGDAGAVIRRGRRRRAELGGAGGDGRQPTADIRQLRGERIRILPGA